MKTNKTNPTSIRQIRYCAMLLALVFAVSTSIAATSVQDGDWNQNETWGGAFPNATTTAVNIGDHVIELKDGAYSSSSLAIGYGSTAGAPHTRGNLTIGGGDSTASLTSTGRVEVGSGPPSSVGANSTVVLNICKNGVFNTSHQLRLGQGEGSTGTAIIDGGDWNHVYGGTGTSTVIGSGSGATGILKVVAGNFNSTGTSNFRLGYADNSRGEIEVSGGNFSNTGALEVGWAQTTAKIAYGLVTVNGGNATVGGTVYVGCTTKSSGDIKVSSGDFTAKGAVYVGYSGGTGNVTVSGGEFNSTGQFALGSGGTGTMTVNETGVFTGTGSVYVGHNGGNGNVTVSGGDFNAKGTLAIGYAGTGSNGTLTIKENGNVTAGGVVYVGYGAGHNGTLIMSGGNYTNNSVSSLLIGQSGATGNVVFSGGNFSHNGVIHITRDGTGSNGYLTVSGGEFNTKNEIRIGGGSGNTGTMNVTGGTANVTGYTTRVGSLSGTGYLNIDGGDFKTNSNILIGDNSNGTMTVTVGNVTVGGITNIGGYSDSATAEGTLTVSGGSYTSGLVAVGTNRGTGTLNITGGSFEGKSELRISTIQGNASLTSTGSGSMNVNNATVTIRGITHVAHSANSTATLDVTDSTMTMDKAINIANAVGSTAEVNITNSTFTTAGILTLGGGTSNGGTLNATDSTLGTTGFLFAFNSIGDATMDLRNTTLTNTGNFRFGCVTGTATSVATLNLDNTSSIINTGEFDIRHTSVLTFEVGADGSVGGIHTGSLVFNAAEGAGAEIIVDLGAIASAFTGTLDIQLIKSDTALPAEFILANLDADYINADGNYIDLSTIKFYIDTDNSIFGIKMSAIPEPSTYAVILGALAVLALAIRRRK